MFPLKEFQLVFLSKISVMQMFTKRNGGNLIISLQPPVLQIIVRYLKILALQTFVVRLLKS